LLEALVTHQRLRAVANERGFLNPEGLIAACATVRRFMLQRRATRTRAPLLLQAAIRRAVHWRAWRNESAARRTQVMIPCGHTGTNTHTHTKTHTHTHTHTHTPSSSDHYAT
jgi:hypothetical protein